MNWSNPLTSLYTFLREIVTYPDYINYLHSQAQNSIPISLPLAVL